MKFFIPNAKDDYQAQEIFEGILNYNNCIIGKILDRKIHSITYKHNNKKYTATVGSYEKRTNEQIIAILESNSFLICTPNRGVNSGIPILVGYDEILSVEMFD
jgi:hypothetical protein